MELSELYLKTAFAVMACDGDIAEEEIEMVQKLEVAFDLEANRRKELLDSYVELINEKGLAFLKEYLAQLESSNLNLEQAQHLLLLVLKMIEADGVVQYSEIKFFKKVRLALGLSDDEIIEISPQQVLGIDIEDFLLPDNVEGELEWSENIQFDKFTSLLI